MAGFTCIECKNIFKSAATLNKHIRNRVCFKKYFKNDLKKRGRPVLSKDCDECNKKFSSRRILLRHRQLYHSKYKIKYPCGSCSRFFTSANSLDNHRRLDHAFTSAIYERSNVLRGACRIYRYEIKESNTPVNQIIPPAALEITKFLEEIIVDLHSFKFCLVLAAEYEQGELGSKGSDDLVPERMLMHFRSETSLILESDDKELAVRQALLSMENNAESFNVNGSGWNLLNILHIDIEIGKCHELAGSCTLHKVQHIRNSSESFVVQKNNQNIEERNIFSGRCFFHAIASYFLNGETDAHKLEAFIEDNIKEDNIRTPVRLADILKFELLNAHLDIGVNVISKSIDGDIFPSYISNISKPKNTVNLLLFYIGIEKPVTYKKSNIEIFKDFDHVDDENNWKYYDKINASSVQHYALIENFEKELTKARRKNAMRRIFAVKADYLNKIKYTEDLIQKIHQDELRYTYITDNPFTVSYKTLTAAKYCLALDERRKILAIKDLKALKTKFEEIKDKIQEYDDLYSLDPNRNRKICICYNCLSIFSAQSALENHKHWCFKQKPSVVLLPAFGEKTEFELKRKHNFSRIQMFFDFECLQVKPEYPCSCRPEYVLKCQDSINKQQTFCKHNTYIETEQKPFYYCLLVCSNELEILERVEYCGDDANDHFIETLLDLEIKYMSYLKTHKLPIRLSKEDNDHFERTNTCHICKKEIKKPQKKVKDHG